MPHTRSQPCVHAPRFHDCLPDRSRGANARLAPSADSDQDTGAWPSHTLQAEDHRTGRGFCPKAARNTGMPSGHGGKRAHHHHTWAFPRSSPQQSCQVGARGRVEAGCARGHRWHSHTQTRTGRRACPPNSPPHRGQHSDLRLPDHTPEVWPGRGPAGRTEDRWTDTPNPLQTF